MNVLRSVALSTNSVAASVEPVMQQQFFTLSPMPGQEFSGQALDVNAGAHGRPAVGMLHTPTTSSMLAALQAEPFPVDSFGADFGMGAFMDTPASVGDEQASGLAFPDFAGTTSFDVAAAFTPTDLAGIPSASATPAASRSPDRDLSPPAAH
jgi:regulatory factor X, other